jgi:hypothetical protein
MHATQISLVITKLSLRKSSLRTWLITSTETLMIWSLSLSLVKEALFLLSKTMMVKYSPKSLRVGSVFMGWCLTGLLDRMVKSWLRLTMELSQDTTTSTSKDKKQLVIQSQQFTHGQKDSDTEQGLTIIRNYSSIATAWEMLSKMLWTKRK